jgi:hypothetical protein
MSPDAMFDKYLSDNRLWSMEGESGVRKFEQVVREIGGYSDLHAFLADNPGALTAMMEFVQEWIPRNEEWQERLVDLVPAPEDDGEEDDE